MEITQEYLNQNYKEQYDRLKSFVINTLNEIENYNNITDEEMSNLLGIPFEEYQSIIYNKKPINIDLISKIHILTCGGITFKSILKDAMKHNVEDIKNYCRILHEKKKQDKINQLLSVLGIDSNNLTEIDMLIEKIKEIKEIKI